MVGCAVEIGRALRRAGTDSAGELHSRVDYTPYGVAMHSYAADLNGNGTIDGTDVGIFLTNLNAVGSPLEPGDAGYDPDADLNGDGLSGTQTDEGNAFTARYSAYSTGVSGNPTVNAGWIDNPTDTGGPDNSVGYDGYWFDLAGAVDSGSTGLYMVRHRVYDPGMGRWGERDPVQYLDGTNVYQYAKGNPSNHSDPTGLKITVDAGEDNDLREKILEAMNTMCPSGNFQIDSDGVVSQKTPEESPSCDPSSSATSDDQNPELCKCLIEAVTSDQDILIIEWRTSGGSLGRNDEWRPDNISNPSGPGTIRLGKSLKPEQTYPGRYEDGRKSKRVPWDLSTALAHELCIHALTGQGHPPESTGIRYTERDPILIKENVYRKELGPEYGIRTH